MRSADPSWLTDYLDRQWAEQRDEEREREMRLDRLADFTPAPRFQTREDRYRSALERIAGSESGVWGQIAHEALREA